MTDPTLLDVVFLLPAMLGCVGLVIGSLYFAYKSFGAMEFIGLCVWLSSIYAIIRFSK